MDLPTTWSFHGTLPVGLVGDVPDALRSRTLGPSSGAPAAFPLVRTLLNLRKSIDSYLAGDLTVAQRFPPGEEVGMTGTTQLVSDSELITNILWQDEW